jgi:hypothetical protein
MRAMRQTLALCVLLLAVGGCDDDDTGGGPDLAAPADLLPPVDMAVRLPDGVSCGNKTCAVGQSCCVTTNGMTASATCIAAGGSCAGGAVLACDGPEDCSGGTASGMYCCGTIQFSGMQDGGVMFNGGEAMCTGTCNFSFSQGSVTTRLCHADVDCTGLSFLGQAVDKCCTSAQAPGLHFCAAPFQGITCP